MKQLSTYIKVLGALEQLTLLHFFRACHLYNTEFLKVTRIDVTECKFVCPMHSEAVKT